MKKERQNAQVRSLGRAIMLSLVLSGMTVGMAMANATITSGTHDIGGTISPTTQYINAQADVTLNATSDITFDANDPYYTYVSSGKGHSLIDSNKGNTVTVNMNNYNLTSGDYGFFATVSDNSGSKIAVQGANDINLSSKNMNVLNASDAVGTISLQANHDVFLSNSEFYPPVAVDALNGPSSTGAHVSIDAGNDVIIYGKAEAAGVSDATGASTIDIIAGRNVLMGSNDTYSTVVAIGNNVEFNITAKQGMITLDSKGGEETSVSTKNHGTARLNANQDVIIGGNTRRALRALTGSTIDITSDTGSISLQASNADDDTNAGVYSSGDSHVNLHSDTAINAVTKGIHADGGAVTFDKNATITDAATGIVTANKGTVSVAGDAVITSTATNISANSGAVTLAKGATLSGAAAAIAATNGGTVQALDEDADKIITGTMTADGDGSAIDVNFNTGNSSFTGATAVSNDGVIDLDLDKGASWNVTDSSSLTSLTNNSFVNMRYTGNNVNETLTTDTLSGNGTYAMNVDLQSSYDTKNVQNNGDKIIINSASSGNHVLDLRDASLDTQIPSQGYLLLVEDRSNGSATFSGSDLERGGIYKYKPVIVTDNPTDYTGFNADAKNWYLTGFHTDPSDNTLTTLGLSDTRYANYVMDNDTLLKRLGELRMMKDNPNTGGVWARYRHGGMQFDRGDGNFTTLQVGYDRKTSDNHRYTGFAFSHTWNNYDFSHDADGSGSQDALTLYSIWFGDKNHYLDIVGKVGKMRGHSDYKNSLYPETGDTAAWYYSLSGEYGRKIMNEDSGWYYEPQVQLTVGHIGGDDYTTSRNTSIHQDGINSIIGRAGITFGKEFHRGDPDHHSNIYAKVNWLHEFNGDTTTHLTDVYGDMLSQTDELGGSWWNAGIGFTVNLNRSTHLYADVEKNFGGNIKSNWIGQIGCRWAFGSGAKKAAPQPVVEPVVEPVQPAPVVQEKQEAYYDSVHFGFDEDQPLAGEAAKVSRFAATAKAHPERTYAMVGNTDSVGTDAYNNDLSKRRVEHVKTLAEQQGVPAAQMQDSYLGKSHPVDTNETEQGRANNRRVDIYEHQ
ncbi:MAG: autotransporter outer membrane beta-barrel domain-containing protein [Megasphaera sp.]|nr:autotransporter outer membrane beta-barrel domain-containing protein [Megasphaera sp.]MCH4217288.1 autotransporter outer membrane beta-barrel domain-containing protein [Megasphaera sp.]